MSEELFLKMRAGHIAYGMPMFDPEKVYIFRFLVRRFLHEIPGGIWTPFVMGVPGFLAKDVPKYEVMNLSVEKVPAYKKVKVRGDDEVTADEGSWYIDIVLRPLESKWVWTEPDVWQRYIQLHLQAWKGYTPDVRLVGAAILPDSSVSENVQFQDVVLFSYWSTRSPVLNVEACAEGETSEGGCPKVSRTTYGEKAWMSGLLGLDGMGLARGLATSPYSLVPIKVVQVKETLKPTPAQQPPGEAESSATPAWQGMQLMPKTTAGWVTLLTFGTVGFLGYNWLKERS